MPVLVFVALAACGAPVPDDVGTRENGSLAPCPETPNCVHTGMRHPDGTEPIHVRDDMDAEELMSRIREVVESMARVEVIEAETDYLHAEERSRLFRFVDDVELLLTADSELVVRSASRLGRSDLGVNSRRVERLRALLGEAGLLR